jgi:hypothetical protein
MIKKLMLCASVLFLTGSGCSSVAVSNKFVFSENSKNGLIVVGASGLNSYSIELAKYDANTQKIEVGVIDRGALVKHSGSIENKFYVLEVKPGTYVFRTVTEFSGNTRSIACLSKGTYKFKVESGKALYIGDIYYNNSRGGVTASKGDIKKANNALIPYPNVTVSLEYASLESVTFKHTLVAFNPMAAFF